MIEDEALLAEQVEYYRARAPEYDQWFQRKGRYDGGPDVNRRWFIQVEEVRQALETFGPCGRILEVAAGTGWWTQELVRYASRITALDSSREALELNQARLLGNLDLEYICADIFEWTPTIQYDVAFFSFWLSHVPASRFALFWERVRAAVKPSGRVFFIDSLQSSTSNPWPRDVAESSNPVSRRKLSDGREFRVIKIFYDPRELERRLESLGWIASILATENFFLYGKAEPAI